MALFGGLLLLGSLIVMSIGLFLFLFSLFKKRGESKKKYVYMIVGPIFVIIISLIVLPGDETSIETASEPKVESSKPSSEDKADAEKLQKEEAAALEKQQELAKLEEAKEADKKEQEKKALEEKEKQEKKEAEQKEELAKKEEAQALAEKKELEKQEKLAKEKKEKELAEQQKKKEQEEAAAKKANAEKAYYTDNTRPRINSLSDNYDNVWNTYWIPVFAGIESGSMSVFEAYTQIGEGIAEYDSLKEEMMEIPEKNLSKENTKLVNEFSSEMRLSIDARQDAMEEIRSAIDKNNMSPSVVEKVGNFVKESDSYMINAVLARTELESSYGFLEKQSE